MFKNKTVIFCPICKRQLRKPDFSTKTSEEYEIERDIRIRRATLEKF